eukprot:1023617-Pelagomonas_calceolata.AAC.3
MACVGQLRAAACRQHGSTGTERRGEVGVLVEAAKARNFHRLFVLAKSFSSLKKVLSLYRKPRTRAEHGLLPELEDWSYYLWNRWGALVRHECCESQIGAGERERDKGKEEKRGKESIAKQSKDQRKRDTSCL